MINSIGKITLASLLAAIALGMPVRVSAQDTNHPAPPTQQPAKPKHENLSFRGKLTSVDKTAKSIVVESKEAKHTFEVTSLSRIVRNGKHATLEDAVVGDATTVAYTKGEDGKLNIRGVMFRSLPSVPPAPSAPTPATPTTPAPPAAPK